MAQTYGFEAPITRDHIAWMLHEWSAALTEVNGCAEAEAYACAEELVVAYLSDLHTFGELLSAFSSPNRDLMLLITELCTEGESQLRPQLLLGASCALRLRQLLSEVDA
ncbi:MAG TPA: hypothetical protein VGF38_21280 [Ktedonobacterales bacterium]|jgi:hypothetical protein